MGKRGTWSSFLLSFAFTLAPFLLILTLPLEHWPPKMETFPLCCQVLALTISVLTICVLPAPQVVATSHSFLFLS